VLVKNASHIFITDQASVSPEAIMTFLESVRVRGRTSHSSELQR